MIALQHTTFINAPAAKAWAWLESMPEHFRDWHHDHVDCRWLDGEGFKPGAKMEVVERLHGKTHRLTMTVTDHVAGRRLDYRISPGLNGSFEVEPRGARSALTATIRFGVELPVVGHLVDILLRLAIAGHINAIRRHQVEEGANLKRLIEATDVPLDAPTSTPRHLEDR